MSVIKLKRCCQADVAIVFRAREVLLTPLKASDCPPSTGNVQKMNSSEAKITKYQSYVKSCSQPAANNQGNTGIKKESHHSSSGERKTAPKRKMAVQSKPVTSTSLIRKHTFQ